ncbi:hypothetical protein JOF56_010658 [Kibdelosporangium banguiense]|uniref:Aminoglycoside phosphotransferase n=1 Tax=Kibdelosporangium banguiense TaxID=1365924 RepID=A0ABS4U0T6_9PSEU|nr:phosphotransferase [Kibdelosporangium banguiense]MBP2330273.1 hypothetical protein [Kibdelosporangium banguiense]
MHKVQDVGAPRMGRRHIWDDLTSEAMAAVTELTGPILRAASAPDGYTSQIAVRLDTESGPVFVKGMRQDRDDVWTQQREAAVNPYVVPLGPRMLWQVTAGGWDLIGFEHVDGRAVDHSPASPDLPLVVETLTALSRIRCPALTLKEASRRWGKYLDDRADGALFKGSALVHSDMNPSNMLTGETGTYLVDWPMATRGAPWIDAACWVVWLIFAGHTPHTAEQWAAKVPAWATACADALDLFAVAQARYWQETVDAHANKVTLKLREAASRWAIHRHVFP